MAEIRAQVLMVTSPVLYHGAISLSHQGNRVVGILQFGHKCGDGVDMINGKPTGSVRVSFGFSSGDRDVQRLIRLITEGFMEKAPIVIPLTDRGRHKYVLY